MVGHLPVDLQQLTQLRMVELATMTGKYVHTLHHIYYYNNDDYDDSDDRDDKICENITFTDLE